MNLTCVDNLAAAGIPFSNESYEDPATNPCNTVANGQPLKMAAGKIEGYKGRWTQGGNVCDTPDDNPDTCCTQCDFMLSTQIAKYGLGPDGLPASPNNGTAIACDPMLDSLTQCRNFRPLVDRTYDFEDLKGRYSYPCGPADGPPCDESGGPAGCCSPDRQPIPLYDHIRETHPDDRDLWPENRTSPCVFDSDCTDPEKQDLPGTMCVGTVNGESCRPGVDAMDECTAGVCLAEWVVTCFADMNTTGGEQGYCIDRRYDSRGAPACLIAQAEFQALCDVNGQNCVSSEGQPVELAYCDGDMDGIYAANQCCWNSLDPSVQNQMPCDPVTQVNLAPSALWERNEILPEETRTCVCEDPPFMDDTVDCTDAVDRGCRDAEGNMIPERLGQFATKFVLRPGGIVYDPAIKGIDWRPGDLGGVPRGIIEDCAEGRGKLDARNRHDGWRENDVFIPERIEEFDRGMCSGSTYTVNFVTPSESNEENTLPFIVDKVGNSLEGKDTYVFETPQFHVIPGSGFPTDNLRVGACDDFAVKFSNKYDMSPENQRKLSIIRLIDDDMNPDTPNVVGTPNEACNVVGAPVAGGPNCFETSEQLDLALPPAGNDPCAAPCLTVDIENQPVGEIKIRIDATEFGQVLDINETYRVVVPGLADTSQMNDPVAYQQAFWDVCGMPLVYADAEPYFYEFSIDEPKCKEDPDQDNVAFSCDNSGQIFNPGQEDLDRDGFGDVDDLCPTVATSTNSGDSDKDGIGNECDTCRQPIDQYNNDMVTLPANLYKLFVRANPWQSDSDDDGIGDVCDNCLGVANCESYGPTNPYEVGDPIEFDNANLCQRDDSPADMIGDQCAGMMLPGATAPIGLGEDDDFDQDGIANVTDICPRQLSPRDAMGNPLLCADGCPEGSQCDMDSGQCNHLDSDAGGGDGVGDECDTCPFAPNPMQVVMGQMEADDEDEDFVGAACETNASCAERKDPRPFAFYEVAANGLCCTVALVPDTEAVAVCPDIITNTGDLVNVQTCAPLTAPHPEQPGLELPVREVCDQQQQDTFVCALLPPAVAVLPGILAVPPGCDAALADAGLAGPLDNTTIGLEDVDFSLDALWNAACFLPQRDQDFDGFGDPCDLCPFAFDPQNLPYVDEATGRLWENDGEFCNGPYSIDNICELQGEGDTEGGGTAGTGGMETGGTGGMETGGGGSGTGG